MKFIHKQFNISQLHGMVIKLQSNLGLTKIIIFTSYTNQIIRRLTFFININIEVYKFISVEMLNVLTFFLYLYRKISHYLFVFSIK